MTNIENLIKQYCPDGVEYKSLDKATNMKRGTSLIKQKAIEGKIPVISGGREPAFYHNQSNREGDVITVAGSGAGAGYVQYFETPIFANDCFTLQGKDGVDTKYVYYCNIRTLCEVYGSVQFTYYHVFLTLYVIEFYIIFGPPKVIGKSLF